MRLSPKAIIGSALLIISYGFWFLYVYVLQNSLFYYYPWIDIPFHIGGGFVISLLIVLLVLFKHSEIEVLDLSHFQFITLWGTMMIGVLWEYYEFFFKLNKVEGSIVIDTIADLINDFIGAVIGLALAYWVIRKYQRKKHNNF